MVSMIKGGVPLRRHPIWLARAIMVLAVLDDVNFSEGLKSNSFARTQNTLQDENDSTY